MEKLNLEEVKNELVEDLKELKEQSLDSIIKEVAIEEGMTEEEVRRHIERFQGMSLNLPKAKTKKEKAKAKSKRKMAKKSKKKNR